MRLSAEEPAPPMATPTRPPAATATEAESTLARIVAVEFAVIVRFRTALMLELLLVATVSNRSLLPAAVMPIRFLARDVPIEAPTPIAPAPTEVAAETMSAVIVEVLAEVMATSRPEFKSLFWTLA